jgi:IclR family acetate operon transcriptional repressor
MLATLEEFGLTEKTSAGYRLGLAVLPLTHAFYLGNELSLTALPVLQDLAESSGEGVSLFVRFGFERIVIQRVDGPKALRYLYPVGQRLPLFLGVGKILAASMSPKELDRLIEIAGDARFANGEIFSREKFLKEIERAREMRYAISCNERIIGVASVAAPIYDSSNATIAAISIAGPTNRMTPERLEELSIEIRRAAALIADQCNAAGGASHRNRRTGYTM